MALFFNAPLKVIGVGARWILLQVRSADSFAEEEYKFLEKIARFSGERGRGV